MARTIIDVPDAQLDEVDALVKLLGISRAEGVRRALKEFVVNNSNVNPDGFGLWRQPEPLKTNTAIAPTTTARSKRGAH